ncbi:MAG TPA: hypothetical protein H9694_03315 [Firmicutes bacterium]|nr:hypothetical protein [Bacillota bacterium]
MRLAVSDRVAGLSRIWSDAKYNFAYWHTRQGLDWDKAYLEFLEMVIREEDPLRYYALLMRFINLLGNGHTYVTMPETLRPEYAVPFYTTFVEGKHRLSAVPERCADLLYAEILAVDGLPIDEYIQEYIAPYVYCRNPKGRFFHGALGYVIGCYGEGAIQVATDQGVLTVEKGAGGKNEKMAERPARFTIGEAGEWVRVCQYDDLLSIYKTGDNLAVIRIATFADGALPSLLYQHIPAVQDCRGFVLDVTGNSGGSSRNASAAAQLFFEGPFSEGRIWTRQHLAEPQASGSYRDLATLDRSDPRENRIYETCRGISLIDVTEPAQYPGCPVFLPQPAVVLADRLTASAAESFLINMKHRGRAVLVGERSYGSNGMPLSGQLPGGGRYAVCTQVCLTEDGTVYEDVGIPPDKEVAVTMQDYRNGYDRILAEGLESLRQLC